MRIEHVPGTSLVHRLDVRAKVPIFALAVAMTFLLVDWLPSLILTVLSLALLKYTGAAWKEIGGLVAPLTFVLVFIVGFAAFGFGGDGTDTRVLFTVLPDGGLPLTVGGLSYGVSLGFRILTMVMLTTTLVKATPIDDFVAAMRQARVPHAIIFVVMTAMRFIPTMQQRADQVLDAQRARGARIDSGGLIGRVRAYIPIMVPLLASGVRMSDSLAAAMVNRGYGATRRPTAIHQLHASARDWIVTAVAIALFIVIVLVREGELA